MPYNAPGLSDLIARTEQNIEQRLPGTWPQAREKTLSALAYAQAGLAAGCHEHIQWVSRQIIPGSADEAELLEHCQFWGVRRKQAARASEEITVTVTDAVTIPARTRWQRVDGEVFVSMEDASSGGAGDIAVKVSAVNAGKSGNTPADTVLSLITPMANVLPDAVAIKGITGGADIESAGELLARLEYRVQYPPFGGNQYDYVRWAREVPGVTRAWCLPTWKGGGTVGVTFVQDNNNDIFPTESDVTRVDDYISGHPDPVTGLIVGKPDGIIVTTFALTRKPVDMEIYISPNTEAMQKAVRQSRTALFYNEASPGGAMAPSHIIRSVAGVTGLNDFDVRKPLDIQYSAATELLVPGVITWK
ncbi:baseplate J/gp47 family protein [Salmonella enterica]|nr:baseplate J/gp47 family protein [Salmonella enterica]EDZ0627983.1 baseplate J/gp47 family protein [Salmonella enterica]EEJ4564902.1 baseplate J/gp47 family protein [Salmonella enterica]